MSNPELLPNPELEWFYPPERKSEFMITISNDRCFNLNQNLCSQIECRIASIDFDLG